MDDVFLEFEFAGALFEVLLVPEPRLVRELRAVQIVANWRFPRILRGCGANYGADDEGCA
jgi:hypothetical protein